MVNKKLKKKTKWHPLSFAGQDDNSQMDESNKSRVPFKMEWKINNENCETASNHYNNKNNKDNTNNHHHNSYHRFEKQRASNKSYSKSHHFNGNFINTTGANRFGKQDSNNHKDLPKKVQFNEDEYTRITTPRQDVLFKKGYLSRPKTQTVTHTHQTYNNGTLDGFYPSYITADSPPLTINGGLASPNGTEYPFIPATPGAFMNDPYGNPVYFMPYPDMYYPPTSSTTNPEMEMGDQFNPMYINGLYSPPLIEENDESISPPVTSTTGTNCSDSSDSSEEISSTTIATEPTVLADETPCEKVPKENQIESEIDTQKGEENNEQAIEMPQEEVQQAVASPVYENGYDSISPYLNPYAPVYYYPLPFYPVPAMGPYSPTEFYQSPEPETLGVYQNGFQFENGRHGKYPKRKKRYRKTLSSSGTSITDYSEDESNQLDVATTESGDSGFLDAKNVELSSDKHPLPSYTPESIDECPTHQSTLNVEVPEFRPKVILQTTKTESRESPTRKSHLNGDLHESNGPVDNAKSKIDNNTDRKVKKRTVKNPVVDKKFLIESAKNIEMQNIDLKKINVLSRKDNVKIDTTWTVVGGKRKMIKEESQFENETSENEVKDIQQTEISPKAETIIVKDYEVCASNNVQTKKPSRKSKQKNKNLNKRNGMQMKNQKLTGFIIEEPTFNHIDNSAEIEEEQSCEDANENEDLNTINDEIPEIFSEAALIEEIPWTAEDIEASNNEIEIKNQMTSSNLSSISENMDESEQTDNCSEHDQTELKQEPEPKAEILLTKTFQKSESICSNQIETIVEEQEPVEIKEEKLNLSVEIEFEIENPQEMLQSNESNLVFNETETKNNENFNEVTEFDQKDESETKDNTCNSPAVLEITNDISEKYHITPAVCNWLHTFDTNDLQSLFTIPLSTDFVEKIKHCSEISKFFADDELENLNKFIDENFCKYQQLSSCSSLSSLISDSDSDEDDTESISSMPVNKKKSSTKKTLKILGCEIM
uniref:CSON008917 protein n=1 Tax=Culicoides sonorensis TaxID=179676 RepID=A0A336LZG9_CULSO